MVKEYSYGEVSKSAKIAATDTSTEIYKVTSGRSFKTTNIIITNLSGITKVSIYDCQSSDITGRRLDVMVGASDTKVLEEKELKAVDDFMSSVMAYSETTSGVLVQIAGYEY